ncbi:amidase [Methylobacterium oryzae]|uniref:amidase n=1 Tax=Methylobacterium oryzae TaxID=334852 RepID=UPI002F35F281
MSLDIELPDALAFASASELVRRLEAREFTARALLEFTLARVDRLNPEINAIVFTDLPAARERADQADAAMARGESCGPLHGLPMTVKETNNVAGWPTTYGDPAMAGFVPTRSAVIVERLRAAGAIIFGKTNVPIHALDWQSYNTIYGTTRNPWDLDRTPGGSSGGSSAALAAGLVSLEIGSDAGGSIRFPAHFCGVYGHKPTPGIVPVSGNERGESLVDNDLVVSGPLARTVADLERALDVIAGPAGPAAKAWRLDLPPPRARRLADFRVAYVTDSPIAEVDEPVQVAIRALVERLKTFGVRVTADTLPFDDHVAHHATYLQLLRGSASARLPQAAFEDAVHRLTEPGSNATPYVLRMAQAHAQRHRDWIMAEERRAVLKRDWATFFESYDVLLAPATVCAAFPIDEARPREERVLQINGHAVDYNDQLFWAGIATLPSLPATAVPIGYDAHLPIGIQVIGPYLEDRTTLAFAAEIERLHPFVAPQRFAPPAER